MSSIIKFSLTILVSMVAGAVAMHLWNSKLISTDNNLSADSNDPLYWVAPMDPNYRRDKPGKSPMGMDLVPVFAEDNSSLGDANGVVEIAPHVVNNLGVRTAEAEVRNLSTMISTVGYVQYDENKLIHIHPRVAGWIEDLYVRAEGDPVRKGQTLYTLYSPELVNAQEEILVAQRLQDKALLNSSKQRLRALQISDDFISKLLKSGQVEQAVPFYATQDGIVDELEVRDGFYVTPEKNLMTIGNLDTVWIEAEVFERDAARVSIGQHVELKTEGFPSKVWQGKVDYIYPTLRAASRTLRLRIGLANPEQLLKPNMFTELNIHTEASQSLVVPQEAVIRTGQQNRVVLVQGEGKFKSIAVSLGRMTGDYAEIRDGLQAGQRVVTSAQFLIDSESSKTSDFMRMSQVAETNAVWMKGTINSIIPEQRMLNITHEEVPEWQMAGMTMNFILADEIAMSDLGAGQSIHFQTERTAQGFLIKVIHIVDTAKPEDDVEENATIDHSQHH